jgi:hypothetical protein
MFLPQPTPAGRYEAVSLSLLHIFLNVTHLVSDIRRCWVKALENSTKLSRLLILKDDHSFHYYCVLEGYLKSQFYSVSTLRDLFPKGSLRFFIELILSASFYPGFYSDSKRNECYFYLLGGKDGWFIGLMTTLPPSCTVCLKIMASSTP